ncbi:hypothetical protein F1C10_08940 [Sphingomonas sp. NBWT7]|uniref:hypothetical protein n=1 Tax=Sphingomonas sp. NBWT7 TaxID=2596913 RepID=UPI001629F507|nr:hypothetical protein [Sphingomonas sp. NBWT7]QNE32054.1 hypothetical protein F1C10_08940 [Sphingomonas sp. NBWT7]
MVDKSWGLAPTPPIERRARSEPLADRLEARAAARAASAASRETARQAARAADAALRESDPHTAAAQRRRGSGRKDIVREDRDTSGYRMVIDSDRIRALAARGATPESLAEVLRLPIETIRQALAEG